METNRHDWWWAHWWHNGTHWTSGKFAGMTAEEAEQSIRDTGGTHITFTVIPGT